MKRSEERLELSNRTKDENLTILYIVLFYIMIISLLSKVKTQIRRVRKTSRR